MHCAKYIENPF